MNEGSRRFVVGVVLPVVVVGLGIGPWLLAWGDLPDQVATHFGGDGVSDGSAPRAVQAGASALAGVVLAAMVAWAARRRTTTAAGQVATWSFVGVLMGLVSVQIVLSNRGLDDWHDARLGIGAVAATVGASLAAAAMAFALAPRPDAGSTEPLRAPSLPIASDERAVWFGHADSIGFRVGAAALIVVGAVLLVVLGPSGGAGGTLLFVGVVFALFSSVEVRADGAGVAVRSGTLPGFRVNLPLDDIVEARAIELTPFRWGGWGYRGSLRLFRRAAWVLRAGPALEVELTGGRRFAVTVDGAEDAAALINGLVARRTSAA